MRGLIVIGKFLRFFYFWMLFFVTVELIWRHFFLRQKMYQASELWLYVAVAINALLIVHYIRTLAKNRRAPLQRG